MIRIKRLAKCNAIDRATTGELDELKDFQALKSAEEGYCRAAAVSVLDSGTCSGSCPQLAEFLEPARP